MPSEKEHIKYLLWSYIYQDSQKAFREFYDLFFPRLIRLAMIFVRNLEAAEDIVSEVFVKFFQRGKRITEIDDVKPYLYRSVKNQAITYLKSNVHTMSVHSDDERSDLIIDIQDPYHQYLHKELQEKLQEVLQSLPPQKKTIYRLIVLEGLKYKEVAALLNISIKTVENHMVEATRQVRLKISKWLHENPGHEQIKI